MNAKKKVYWQEIEMEARGFVTIHTAARRIGRMESTLYRWLKKGKVRGTKVGSKNYLEISSLLSYLGDEGARLYSDASAKDAMEAAQAALLEVSQ